MRLRLLDQYGSKPVQAGSLIAFGLAPNWIATIGLQFWSACYSSDGCRRISSPPNYIILSSTLPPSSHIPIFESSLIVLCQSDYTHTTRKTTVRTAPSTSCHADSPYGKGAIIWFSGPRDRVSFLLCSTALRQYPRCPRTDTKTAARWPDVALNPRENPPPRYHSTLVCRMVSQ